MPIEFSFLETKDIDAIIVFGYSDIRQENFCITKLSFILAKHLKVKKIIFLGSSAIYDINNKVSDETSDFNRFHEHYAITKFDLRNQII